MEESLVKELYEIEVRNLSDIELKRMFIRMLKEVSDKCKEPNGNYNSMKKEIETINKNQEGIKNTIYEIKNTLEGITSKLNEAEDRISELEDKVEKIPR